MIKRADEAQAQVKRATRAAYGETLVHLAQEGLPVVAVDLRVRLRYLAPVVHMIKFAIRCVIATST